MSDGWTNWPPFHVCRTSLCQHVDTIDLKVISDVVAGLTNTQIAAKHGYSRQSIKNRLFTIGRKLGLPRNRSQRTAIAVYAVRKGWV